MNFWFQATKLATAVSFVLFTLNAAAFINVEALRQVPGEGFVGKSGLQLQGQSGNTDKFTSQLSSLGVFRSESNELLALGNYKYGSSFDVKDTDQGSFHVRYTLDHRETTAYELFVQTEFDRFKDLNSRHLAGVNLRQRLIDKENHQLFAGLGSFYEIEDFSGNKDKEGFRGNIYLSYLDKVSELISASAIVYYQPSFELDEDYRVRFNGGVDVRLSDWLSIDIDFNLTHDNGLPPDVQKTDIDYFTGISVAY